MTCSLDRAHARVIPCFIAFGDPVFIRSAELSGIQRAFFIKNNSKISVDNIPI